MTEYIAKHQERILGTLSGFDRVRFRGTFRVLAVVHLLMGWLAQRRVLMKDFGDFAESLTERLRQSVEHVADLPRRAEISQAANARYLTAQAAVDSQTPLGKVADQLAKPVVTEKSRARGLNPLTGIDARLIDILLRGEFALNGFRNRDVRDLLFPPPKAATSDGNQATQRRRQSGQVTRLLRLFRAHGLIQKIPRTHRYQLTAVGRRILPTFPAARSASTQALNQIAA